MKNIKNNLILLSVFVFILFVTIPIARRDMDERAQGFFIEFDSTEINSKIEAIDSNSRGIRVTLQNGRNFVFYPYSDEGKGTIFNYTACKGDSIAKRAYSDTLYLIKKDIKYSYTFAIDSRKKKMPY